MLRVALVGCGQIADAHLVAVRRTGLALPVAVCDRSIDLARQAAARFAVTHHGTDFDDLLARTRPDVVHITTPPATHQALLEKAVDAGAHVYVEKPFAMNVAEADGMLDRAAERRRLVCVGHDRLFDPTWIECREGVARGAIGAIRHVEVFQAYDLDGPFGRVVMSDDRHWVRQLRGGLLQNAIPHALATIADVIPDEQPVVTAMSWRRKPSGFDTELQALIRGLDTTATLTFLTGTMPASSYVRVYGTGGWLEVDYDARTTRRRSASTLPSALAKLHTPWSSMRDATRALARNTVRLLRSDLQYFAGMQDLIHRFYCAILEHGPSPIPASHVRRVQLLLANLLDAVDCEHGTVTHGALAAASCQEAYS